MARAQRRKSSTVRVEHFVDESLTYIILSGVIDESFDTGSLSSSITTKRVVINCAGITQISSFGLRQWFRLMDDINKRSEDLYFVECSPKVIDQLNLVAGFGGMGQVLSFYAPYQCERCRTDRRILFRVDLDRQMLRDQQPPTFTCRVCEGKEYLDDDPEGYFSWFTRQGEIDVDPAVRSLLRGRLDYSPSSQLARPQIEKYVRNDMTFVAIRGTLDGTLPSDKIVSGLEGIVVIDTSGIVFIQPSGLEAWDRVLGQLLESQLVQRIYLSGIPPLALERGSFLGHDTGDRFQLISVMMPFECPSCSATSWHQLPMASRPAAGFSLETLPKKRCSDCGATVQALASTSLLNKINSLPVAAVPGKVKRFVHKAPEQLEAQRNRYRAKDRPVKQPRTLLAAALGGMLVIAGVGAVAAFYFMSNQSSASSPTAATRGTNGSESQPTKPEANWARPDWISSDRPASGHCFDTPVKIYCVGVSRFRDTKKDAMKEAWTASLEELVNLVAIRAQRGPVRVQRELYSKLRLGAFAEANELRESGDGPALRDAYKKIHEHRDMVAKSLLVTGSGAVPAQQSDSYWEEYERTTGVGTEFLGFSQVEISNSAVEALARQYSETKKLAGATIVPAFPGLAWRTGKPATGFFVLDAGQGALREAGAKDGQVISGVGGKAVSEIGELESAVRARLDAKKRLKLDVVEP